MGTDMLETMHNISRGMAKESVTFTFSKKDCRFV